MNVDRYTIRFVLEDKPTKSQIIELIKYLASREVLVDFDGFVVDLDIEEATDYAERVTDDYITLFYEGTECILMTISETEGLVDQPAIEISIDEGYLLPKEGETNAEAISRMQDMFGLLGDLYEQFKSIDMSPIYIPGLNFAEHEIANDEGHPNCITTEKINRKEIPGIYWFQILTPDMVDRIGIEHVRATPAVRLEELFDGAILLAGSDGVLVPEAEDKIEQASRHLNVPFEA